MKLLVPWLRKSGFQGRSRLLDLKLGVFEVFWGQKLTIFKPGQMIYQNEALAPLVKKSGFRGHPRTSDPRMRVFEVIWRQNSKIVKLGQIKK